MKQFIFMILIMSLGTFGAFQHVFWGLLLYYGLAVLRPQYLWAWALPEGWRWSLMAAGAVLLGAIINFPTLASRGRLNAVAVTLIAYSLLVLLSILNAFDPGIAQEWGAEFGKIAIVAIIASIVVDSVWQIDLLGKMILVTTGYIAWEVNSLYVFQGRLDIYRYGYGGLDNNGAGLVVAMGIPFAYAFGLSARHVVTRWGSWFLGLLMLHAMLMSYSRGAMLATLVGAIWLLLHHRPRKQAVLIAAAACLAVSILAGPEIRARFMTTGDYANDPSVNSRFDSWSAAWAIATDNPITGQGLRNSNLFTHKYGADVQGRTIHSQYLQIAADSGIPAMISYIILVGLAILTLSRARTECVAARDHLDALAVREQERKDAADRKPFLLAPAPTAEASPLKPAADVDAEPVVRVDRRQADDMARLMLACQTSLIIFSLGGVFLSLEVFELPWLLIVMAGVAPAAIRRELQAQRDPRTAPPPLPITPASPPRRRRFRRNPEATSPPGLVVPAYPANGTDNSNPPDSTSHRPALAP